MKALIADDHAIVRTGLKQILISTKDISEVDEAADGHEVLQLCRENEYGLMVLDISMPNLSGLDALVTLNDQFPELPVLVLSMHPEKQFAMRALKLGAAGYLTKDAAPEELCNAVKKILEGKKYITPEFAEIMLNEINNSDDKPLHKLLSGREFQILRLIASGQAPAQIADVLCLSVKTIGSYRQRILQKLSLKSTSDLIHYAIKNNIIE
jgi:two-component system, NarL family, invasion response regulator UvrY